jgi:4-hydroxybenzoate polyprenyltransferase
MIFALVLAGQSMHFGQWYYGGLTTAALLFLYQQWLIRDRNPAGCLRAFLNNQYVGMVIFVGILLQYVYAR